ncbi:MAG: methyltransferase domain-containing protein, partial [Chloroflexota bacterium]|nr:methyltransferase domain-containing protein [Chloroflexota bacterium]
MSDSRALRRALVEKLRRDGQIRSERVAEAFLAVPREAFVPGVPLDEVYRSSEAILTKRVDGVGVSSASAPDVMAVMLEQLDVRPGMRVLEIGAGTGYNAALLAHLVGSSGSVVSLDIDADLVEGAREHLRSAGLDANVTVLQGDGALGHAARAPYDRIILTVASRDLAPAWREQLAPDGRLLLPLAIRGSLRCVLFEVRADHLVTTALGCCSFIPLRGVLAMESTRVPMDSRGEIVIGLADDAAAAPPGALNWLVEGLTSEATGVRTGVDRIRGGLH